MGSCYIAQGSQLCANLERWDEGVAGRLKRERMYKLIVDSCCSTAETNIAL